MTALAYKIRDTFSDFWLEIELFFDKIFHRNKKETVGTRNLASKDKDKEKKIEEKAVTGMKQEATKISFGLKMLRMSSKDRLYFYDQMATLVDSSVTLIDSLSLVQAQTTSKGLKKLYGEMIHHINTGMSLAESMYLFPHIFPKMQAALVEAAEKSGNLSVVLIELTEEMEANQDFMRKITGAMFYPVVLVCLSMALVAGMMTFVIPKIAAMYDQAKVELPKLTQAVIDISDFVAASWMILLISIVGTVVLLWLFFVKTRIGRLIWENFVSIIPIVGRLNKEKNLMMIAANMGMLMKSGVLISDAFAITEKTIPNLHYQRALAKIRHGIIMGKQISEMMGLEDIRTQKFKKNKLFPLQVAQLIHIGESTGRISEMLFKIKKNFHKSIDYTLKNISTLVEPIMIFIVAALVGSILLAVMLPFFYIGTTIN
ncbi:type II secretion system F family protein [Patescibacteria group bacterium]|nr:type II secretion system F family protein [Patescibacteria group bacterium]MBU1682968.1 type II secretion system F family protein [Patescibacteria group bacterium]MBU1934880.1 type II secretion system F family protein [Patescibacteria group bacterium]